MDGQPVPKSYTKDLHHLLVVGKYHSSQPVFKDGEGEEQEEHEKAQSSKVETSC